MRTFTLDSPVDHTHYGATSSEIINGHVIELRADVGLLYVLGVVIILTYF